MTSLNKLKLQFRVHPLIYTVDKFMDAMTFLDISVSDLIITSTFIIELFKQKNLKLEATILNTDDYGKGEPKDEWVDQILSFVNLNNYKRIIAIGGGTTIDISKYCVFDSYGTIKELFDNKSSLIKKRKLVAMPTTCGTGSEVTNVAVVERKDLNSKLGLQIDAIFPDIAILCPELLETLPLNIYVSTSIDALTHAIESYLSPKCSEYSAVLSEKAIEIILHNLKKCHETKKTCNLKDALIASNMAGIAFSIGGCATMHACAFPLGANYHLPHGIAVYETFKACINYYESHGVDIRKLKRIVSVSLHVNEESCLDDMYKTLESIIKIPSFKELGITEKMCQEMAQSVYDNQQRLLINSPITLSSEDIDNIYKNCLKEDL